MSLYIWIATGLIALAGFVILAKRRRYGSIVLATIVTGVLYALRGADPSITAPFILVYVATLILATKIGPIVHGVAGIGILVFVLQTPEAAVDWRTRARERFVQEDYVGAFEAYGKAYEAASGDVEFLDDFAQTCWLLQLHTRSIELLGEAVALTRRRFLELDEKWRDPEQRSDELRVAVGDAAGWYARVLRNRVSFMSSAGAPDEALTELDRAMKNEMLGKHGTLLFASAELRMSYLNRLLDELKSELELHHPDRVGVEPLLFEHMRSSSAASEARRRLVGGLVSERLRSETSRKLEKMWDLLHEADTVLGDIRTSSMNRILPARLVRAEIDYRLGRFVRAKEEMQCLLETAQAPAERQRALVLLAEMMMEAKSYFECALWRRELIAANGGDAAPTPFHSDYFEALFFSAESAPEFRSLFLTQVDKYLSSKSKDGRKNDEHDLRTLGYRGVAALRYENDPARALLNLRPVYDGLLSNRTRDFSILRPKRAKLFVESILEASALSKNQADRDDGIQFASVLLEVSAADPALRIRRANLFEASGRFAEAAADLKLALRTSKLDFALFDRWLEVSEKVKDAAGNTPLRIAEAAAERASKKLEELREELDRQASFHKVHKLRQSPQYITRAFASIFEFESSLATDPVIAWHMAHEFGRLGETTEARNFLFKAVTSEPDILPFRMRLGELRLDMGLYPEAASDFQAILDRDPSNIEAALRAIEALSLSGDLLAARRLRLDVMKRAPETAALEFAIRDHLDNGRIAAANELIGPHLGTQNPQLALLIGLVRLADGKAEPALVALNVARAARPESAEIARALVLATAMCRGDTEMLAAADSFVRLPRILPVDDLIALIDRLTELGKHTVAAYIGDGVLTRYTGASRNLVEGRAILANFRAANASPLRKLLDDPKRAQDFGDGVIRAAFGLALRERGAATAAVFLQDAREHGAGREAAALPIAGAFALTPHVLDLGTFLGRFERAYSSTPLPLDDQTLWMLTRERSTSSAELPKLEAGADAELAWIVSGGADKRVGDSTIAESYIRFLLFRYAGEGFEEDARKLAEAVVTADRKALTAARFVAADLARRGDGAGATAYLIDKYQSMPGDLLTFLALGELLDKSAPDGAMLRELAANGKKLFPSRREPYEFAARAALRLGSFGDAEAELNSLLDKNAKDGEALDVLVDVARAANDPELARRAVTRIQNSALPRPKLLEYLVEYCTSPTADAITVVTAVGPFLAAEPRFYAGARLLAKALESQRQTEAIINLATNVALVAEDDPGAAGHAADFLGISEALEPSKSFELAIRVVEAGLLSNPGDVQLRRQRVELARISLGDGAAIDDLEVLCGLAPRVVDLLFSYGDLLLTRRGDKIDTVLSVFPILNQLAPNDARTHYILANVHFIRPRHARPANPDAPAMELIRRGLEQVRLDLRQAVSAKDGRQEYWYMAGINSLLMRDDELAKVCLSKISEAYRLFPRAQLLLELIEARRPKP